MTGLAHHALDRARTAAFRWTARQAGGALARSIRALAGTWRVDLAGEEHLEHARTGGRGVLHCFWHGRMLELAALHADRGIGVLVSSHPDGMAAARIVEPLGYVPIVVSRLTSPVAGVRAMLRHADRGLDLALASDARSPVHRAHPGAVALARLTGHPLVPVAAGARPLKRIESWDRFEVPWPGARVVVRYGEAVVVPRAADAGEREAARVALERSLRALHADVEAELEGRPRTAARPSGVPVAR